MSGSSIPSTAPGPSPRAIPDWAISIALVRDGRPVLGILYAPIHDRLYEAGLGEGRLVQRRARCRSPAADALPAPGSPVRSLSSTASSGSFGPIDRLPKVPSLALRLARVAEGSIDVGLVSANAQDWDIAAADLILQEAGALLTGLDGSTARL